MAACPPGKGAAYDRALFVFAQVRLLCHGRPRISSTASSRRPRRTGRRCCCCTAPAATRTICCRSRHGVAPGAALLSPRGKVLEHGMPRFFRRSGEGVFDLDDLKRAHRRACRFLKARAPPMAREADRAWLFQRRQHRRSLLLAEPRCARRRHPDARHAAVRARGRCRDLAGMPVLMLSGRHDELIPPQQAGLLAAFLGEAGAKRPSKCWRPGMA